MADKRKVFPIEKVLELVAGRQNADVKEIAGYLLGETVDCDDCARAVAPFAAAWLARWYPRFVDIDVKDDESWPVFVKQGANAIGDHVSVAPMDGKPREQALQVLKIIRETDASLARQTRENMELERRIKALEPLEASLAQAQKKIDELEAKIKSMKSDALALQRKVAEFQGKLPLDHDALMETIKDAIKDGMKGMVVAGAAVAAADAAAPEAATETVEEEAGFGFGSSVNSDGFGF